MQLAAQHPGHGQPFPPACRRGLAPGRRPGPGRQAPGRRRPRPALGRWTSTATTCLQAQLALANDDTARALSLTAAPVDTLPPDCSSAPWSCARRRWPPTASTTPAAQARARMDGELQGMDQAQNEREIVQALGRLGPDALKQRRETLLAPGSPMRHWIDRDPDADSAAIATAPPAGQPAGRHPDAGPDAGPGLPQPGPRRAAAAAERLAGARGDADPRRVLRLLFQRSRGRCAASAGQRLRQRRHARASRGGLPAGRAGRRAAGDRSADPPGRGRGDSARPRCRCRCWH